MDLETLRGLFFWCMVVNSAVYLVTALAAVLLRGMICTIHKKLFGLDEAAVNKGVFMYLAGFKLLITVFNFAPWVALLILA